MMEYRRKRNTAVDKWLRKFSAQHKLGVVAVHFKLCVFRAFCAVILDYVELTDFCLLKRKAEFDGS